MATMVNMNNLLNGKDSRWLQLEVCREFQRNKCSRPDTECKFAHPPANVEVQNGRVTACYDSIKGRCNREKPPCKYFHPPQHLKDQLLINGRNHLALKNALMQQMGLTPGQPLVPGQVPTVATNPYLTGVPQVGSTYSPYFAPGPIMPTIVGPDPTGVGSPLGVVPQTVVTQQKMPRSDRLEVCREFQRGACKRAESECRFAHPADSVTANEDGTVTVCMDAVKGRCNRDPCRYFHPPLHLQAQIKAAQSRASAMDMKTMGSFYYDNFAFPGMVPYKRPAADKSGVPVYQPNATTYQQLMQLQQPFVPVSCEYSVSPSPAPATSNASPAATDTSQLPQSSSQVVQIKEEDANTIPASTSVTVPPPSIPDPATLAKEVAQQNYAKAVKLAAANSSLTTNPLNHLNPLNYTGIALNKQAVGITSAQAAAAAAAASFPRFPALPVGIGTASTGLNHLAFNPYNAYAQTTNLLNFARAPQAAATVFNPYSFIRTPFPVTTTSQFVTPNMLTTGQYPVSVAAAAVTQTMTPTMNNVPPPPTHIAAAAAQNNNNSVVPPYKKLKTS